MVDASSVAPGHDNPIHRYERAFADALGVPHAVSFYKGRVALHGILKALGVGVGDNVVFPGFTCVMVPNAAVYLGARPLYVDISRATLNMDPERLQERLAGMTAKEVRLTKAIVVQHTFGIPADVPAVRDIARHYDIAVVEDCAHALGSTVRGHAVGSLGDAAFFSSQWSKPYSTGLGGIAVTASDALGQELRTIQAAAVAPRARESLTLSAQIALHRALFRPALYWPAVKTLRALSSAGLFVGSSSSVEFRGEIPSDYLKRMGSNQAIAGARELRNVERSMSHRRRIADTYYSAVPRALTVARSPEWDAVLLRFPVVVRDKEAALAAARARAVELGSWFESVLHPARDGFEAMGYAPGSCPNGEWAAKHVVNLPTHSRVTPRDAARALDIVLAFA